MPPKAKFTKAEIVTAALAIVKESGIEALTARTLGAKLGSSARPIFTVFNKMDEVIEEVIAETKIIYKNRIDHGLSETLAFRGVGIQYIMFAVEEPKLFQLLFMKEQENIPNINGILPMIDNSYEQILKSIVDEYDLSVDKAKQLYQHLWIYTHGIATLCVTRMCKFTGDEISEMIKDVCISVIRKMKEEK